MSRKRKIINILISAILLIGVFLALYPIIGNYFYQKKASAIISSYEESVGKMSKEERENRLETARKYNRVLIQKKEFKKPFEDPYRGEGDDRISSYGKMLEQNGIIGHIEIPSINLDLPIYPNASDEVLDRGVGHVKETSLPVGGSETVSIMAGHRGTSNGNMFLHLNKLDYGDRIFIKTMGKPLEYRIDDIKVVRPEELNSYQIHYGQDSLVLVTCTPYLINNRRIVITANRTAYNSQDEVWKGNYEKIAAAIKICIVAVAVMIVLIIKRMLIKE